MILFQETCHDPKNYVSCCDDGCYLKQYDKTKTFNEMRRDLYESNEIYVEHKFILKEKNKLLHEISYNNKSIEIWKILYEFDVIELVGTPKCLKEKINNARFIMYDGNTVTILFENKNYFYVFGYYGS